MVKSAKGKEIDMDALRNANANTVALGNASMNARRGGKIIKTREELAREYHNAQTDSTVKNVAISKTSQEIQDQQKAEKQKIKEKQQEAKQKTAGRNQKKSNTSQETTKKESSEDSGVSDSKNAESKNADDEKSE